MILLNVKDLGQYVETMNTMRDILIGRARALDFIPNRHLEFDSPNVLQDETGAADDADEIELFHPSEEVFDKKLEVLLLFWFGLFAFLLGGVHFWINLIYCINMRKEITLCQNIYLFYIQLYYSTCILLRFYSKLSFGKYV